MLKSFLILLSLALQVGAMAQNFSEESASKPSRDSYPRTMFERTLKLPYPLSDRAIFQRHQPINIYGWDLPETTITVSFNEKTLTTVSNQAGEWSVEFPPMEAGGPHTISISGSQNQILRDILIGDVFILSGQSNMEWPVHASDDPALYAADAADDFLRLFSMAKPAAAVPQEDVYGAWISSQRDSFLKFPAIGFHMGRQLRESKDIPIGLIDTGVGGSRAEAWLPDEEFSKSLFLRSYHASLPVFDFEIQRKYEDAFREFAGTYQKWLDLHLIPFNQYPSDWTPVNVPGYIETKIEWHHNGGLIFRRKISIDASETNDDYFLSLGVIDDYDKVYFNNVQIGKTHYSTPKPWAMPRMYRVPKELIREENELLIRVIDVSSVGGFAGPAELMTLSNSNRPEAEPISLSGEWEVAKKFSLSVDVPPSPEHPRLAMHLILAPAVFYNGAIHPFKNMKFAGVLWYQGESNTDHYRSYEEVLSLLSASWRTVFEQPDLPFYIFQLSAFGSTSKASLSKWAETRQAQLSYTDQDPNSYFIPTIDYGDCHDVHSKQKEVIGLRVAEFIEAVSDQTASPPAIPRMTSYDLVADHQALLTLEGTEDNALVIPAEIPIKGFWTSDDSRIFFPATAEWTDDGILLTSTNNTKISAIRYLWADCPEDFLVAENGYPLLPIRTDDWDDALSIILEEED